MHKNEITSRTEKELEVAVERAFVDMETSLLCKYTDDENPLDPAALAKAWKWYAEWQLKTWVMERNYDQGVAPATRAVLARYEKHRSAVSVNM